MQTSPTQPLPVPAARALSQLGADINRARRRRQLTQQSLAERAGVSLNTVKRLEAGEPQIQMQALARVLLVFGELARLEQLLETAGDDIGLALMDEQLPQRVRPRKAPVKAF